MCAQCRILIVEDFEDDAHLMVRVIRREGYEVIWERVQTSRELEAALDGRQWDLVIADYVQPEYCGLSAFLLVRNKGLRLPFFIVSGSDDPAMQAVARRMGVDEYLSKNDLSGLAAAVRRHLPEKHAV